MNAMAPDPLRHFAKKHHLEGLTSHSLRSVMEGGQSVAKARSFLAFQRRIDGELLHHRIITGNPYTAWFSRGEQTREQVRAFIVQFSVFSNLFLIAQLFKTINADSLQGMRASKEILANEIGVVFNAAGRRAVSPGNGGDTDPELVSSEGTVEGGVVRFGRALRWLFADRGTPFARFQRVGKRRHGPAALFFCDDLVSSTAARSIHPQPRAMPSRTGRPPFLDISCRFKATRA